MTREGLLRQLRHQANQTKSLHRYYEDLAILIAEANYTDDFLINAKKFPGKQTTPSLTISINLVTEAMAEYLKLGLPLDLYAPYEFGMVFSYLTFIYGILQNNRRVMIIGFCNDLYKSGLISFEDSENQQFNKRRRKMTPLQKLVCDQFVFFNALQEFYSATAFLFLLLMKEGHIQNPLRGIFAKDKEANFVERNTYRRRFYLFKYLNFPRYHEYDEYEKLYNKVFEEDTQEAITLKRNHYLKGMKLLNQVKSTEEDLRNTDVLSNEILDELCKIAANNLLVLMRAQNPPAGQKPKIVIDVHSNEWLPMINVQYV
jgi:hypothetical protein